MRIFCKSQLCWYRATVWQHKFVELLPSTTIQISSWQFNRWAQASVTRPIRVSTQYVQWLGISSDMKTNITECKYCWHYAKVSNEKWTACETVTVLSFNYLIVMQYYFRYLEIAILSDSVSRRVIGKLKYMSNMPSIPEPLRCSSSFPLVMGHSWTITW